MRKARVAKVLALVMLTLAACTTQDFAGDVKGGPAEAARPIQDDVTTNTGSRMDSDPPSSSNRGSTASGGEPKEGSRGNTPPGTDRSGQGPATGAIVDPAGATKSGKPY
jgi:hypothetical protein